MSYAGVNGGCGFEEAVTDADVDVDPAADVDGKTAVNAASALASATRKCAIVSSSACVTDAM